MNPLLRVLRGVKFTYQRVIASEARQSREIIAADIETEKVSDTLSIQNVKC